MSFKDLAASLAQEAMKIVGDLAVTASYFFVSVGDYDPATDSHTNVETEQAGVKMVLARFAMSEVYDDVAVTTDYKAIIAARDLNDVPGENDYIVTDDNKRFEVRKLLGVPGKSLYILHIREV